MAPKQIFLAAALSLFFCLEIVSSASPSNIRNKRDIRNDIKNGLEDLKNEFEIEKIKIEFQQLVDSIWGGYCLNDNVCYEEISYCDKDPWTHGSLLSHIVGKCLPRGWVFLSMVVVGFIMILSVIACCACIKKCFC